MHGTLSTGLHDSLVSSAPACNHANIAAVVLGKQFMFGFDNACVSMPRHFSWFIYCYSNACLSQQIVLQVPDPPSNSSHDEIVPQAPVQLSTAQKFAVVSSFVKRQVSLIRHLHVPVQACCA